MTFTYTAGGATAKDDIRFALGDVDAGAPATLRLEDEEIARLTTIYGTTSAALLPAAEGLLAKFARAATDKTVGNLRLAWATRYEALKALVVAMRNRGALTVSPYAGGISEGDKQTVQDDTDRRQPAFVDGMLDNPDAASQAPFGPTSFVIE